MKRNLSLYLSLALLLCSVPMRAQWSGSVDLAGGLGVMEGNEITDDEPMYHGLEYEYKHNRFFTRTTVSFTSVENEIDQTWADEEIEELQEFWVEEVRRNRRIIVLGAKWKF